MQITGWPAQAEANTLEFLSPRNIRTVVFFQLVSLVYPPFQQKNNSHKKRLKTGVKR